MFVIFPFAAIVGQELLKKALLVNAIDPSIGGLLVRGSKGSGKSTAVRALADLLPKIKVVEHCRFRCHPDNTKLMCNSCQETFESAGSLSYRESKMEIINMPLSVTEDMVVGSLDIKRALKEGIKALEPGILAKANRNILYIDEVNLLDSHIVNILLDSAAMGVNIVEREGISLYHPSRFILIGTMNPEEGDLRPQLLDRFGLCVDIEALNNKEDRLKIVEYRREYDKDAWTFEERFKDAQEALKRDILHCQSLLKQVLISPELLEKIVGITISLGIRTHRADIVMEKTSRVLAAIDDRKYVTEYDIKEAALLALAHRMRQQPFEKSPPLSMETLQKLMDKKPEEEIFDFDKTSSMKKEMLRFDLIGTSTGKDFPKTTGERGLYINAKESENPKNIAIDATFRKAVRETGQLEILPEHVMEKIRVTRGEALYIILLDSSSSMRMDRKIRLAKALSWQLLKQSYENRNRVAFLTFKGDDAQVLVSPTQDILNIEEALKELPTGGKTPLTPALYKAFRVAKKETKAMPVIILISDGKGNVFMKNTLEEDLNYLSELSSGARLVVVNTENKHKSIGLLEEIAASFKAHHFYLDEVLA